MKWNEALQSEIDRLNGHLDEPVAENPNPEPTTWDEAFEGLVVQINEEADSLAIEASESTQNSTF